MRGGAPRRARQLGRAVEGAQLMNAPLRSAGRCLHQAKSAKRLARKRKPARQVGRQSRRKPVERICEATWFDADSYSTKSRREV